MIRKTQNGLEWLEFELFAPFTSLKHAIFLRHGGSSQGAFSSLNLGYNRGDDADHVAANIAKVKKIMYIDHLVSAHQVHRDDIAIIESKDSVVADHDALLTQQPHIGLKVTHADCQAAIFYDPIQNCLVMVHCGWRGLVCNLYSKVTAVMQATYSTKPENIHVGISPSLGPQHAEFVHYQNEFPQPFWDFQVKPNYFNLWEIGLWQLTQAGILKAHVQIAELCTYTHSNDFFSYRRNKGTTGVHGTIAMLSSNVLL